MKLFFALFMTICSLTLTATTPDSTCAPMPEVQAGLTPDAHCTACNCDVRATKPTPQVMAMRDSLRQCPTPMLTEVLNTMKMRGFSGEQLETIKEEFIRIYYCPNCGARIFTGDIDVQSNVSMEDSNEDVNSAICPDCQCDKRVTQPCAKVIEMCSELRKNPSPEIQDVMDRLKEKGVDMDSISAVRDQLIQIKFCPKCGRDNLKGIRIDFGIDNMQPSPPASTDTGTSDFEVIE